MSTVIHAKGLTKVYGTTYALNQANFKVEAGQIIGLIGPNGAGKTTALKAILGLTKFDGELRVLGLDPYKDRAKLMENVCFIADVAVLPRWMKVSQAIEFVEKVHPKFNRSKAEDFLKRTKINPDSKIKALSKGMVTQLHLALVMAIDVKLLILDEPTLGLDILYRKEFYSRLLNDYFDDQKTILITTHQVEEVEHILSDLLFIDDGKIVLDESMEDIATLYSEVLVSPENYDLAESYAPIHKTDVFGKRAYLYRSGDFTKLQALGETRTPGVADLFVAIMQNKRLQTRANQGVAA
ncbi:MAG: ABC transporter ATP-binding protein [Gammaproteobacteria bacterium]|nr:ABC transporter ATP-binding protein [Gammaproteobacteria bacterium]